MSAEPGLHSQPGASSITSRVHHDEPHESMLRRRVPFLFSVRFGITAWYAGVLILTIALLGIGFRMLLVRALEQDAQERLMEAALTVREHTDEEIVSNPQPGRAGARRIEIVPDFNVQSILLSGVSVTIMDASGGDPIFQRGAYSELWPTEEDIAELQPLNEPTFMTTRVDNYSLRSLAMPIFSTEQVDRQTEGPLMIGMIFTTESLATTNRMLGQLNQILLVSGIVGAGIASVGGWVLAGRALAPVSRIMNSADDIAKDRSPASLSRRLEVPRTGDEIAQLAETFNAMLDRIEQAFATQRRFVADASHELRTPLTSIKGNIDVLRRQLSSGRMPNPEDISEALGDVGRESARMGRLVEDLLALARNESAGFRAGQGVISLDVLAREAVRTAEGLLRGQTLTLHAPDPVTLHGSGDQLVQVMLILLDNAIRHTPADGSVDVWITKDIDPVDDVACARIDVEDTGQGIDHEHLPHLFQRFYRADGARDRHSGGTGLGLAIALSIVRAHSGWIDVESAPGAGTHFTVWLPLPDEPAEEDDRPASRLMPRVPRRKPISEE